jgi:hypothetical protein
MAYAAVDRRVRYRAAARRLARGPAGAVLAAAAAFVLGFSSLAVYHTVAAPGAAATDAMASRLDGTLKGLLHVGFFSPGHAFGGKFSTGTLINATENAGGMMLSVKQNADATGDNSFDVMLGLNPPDQEYGAVDAHSYLVRCYRYYFGQYERTVSAPSSIRCPDGRTDGEPGSPAAEFGALIVRQPTSTLGALATNRYPRSLDGVDALLKDVKAVPTARAVNVVGVAGTGGPVFVVAARIDDVCEFIRIDSSPTVAVPFWLAPADQQASCSPVAALAESQLYGIDPVQEG